MKKGGYQILDLKNKNLTSGVGMVFDGIYEQVEGTRKTHLVSGLQVGEVEFHDMFVLFTSVGSSFVGVVNYASGVDTTGTITFKIDDTDVVTVTIA